MEPCFPKIVGCLLFIVFLALTSCGNGKKEIELPFSSGDTARKLAMMQKEQQKYGLADLLASSDKLHFRFHGPTEYIDIWTEDEETFYGSLTHFASPISLSETPLPDSLRGKFYCHTTILDTSTARLVYNTFNELSIFSIPSSNKIKGWDGAFLDGFTYSIAYSTPTTYSIRGYLCPESFKSEIRQAKQITQLIQRLETQLHLHQSFNDFIGTLPVGCYQAEEQSIRCNPVNLPDSMKQ